MAWGWLVAFAAFVAYAALFAPPDDPELTRALVKGAFTGQFGRVDPSVAAIFSVLGVVPMLASTFVLRDGATRKLPAWPFAMAMFAVGAFALLPWLALRGLGGPRVTPRAPGAVRRLLARPLPGWGLLLALVGLFAWAVLAGSASAYHRAFRSTAMVHVMSIDLVVCAALLFVLMTEARSRPIPNEPAPARVLRFVPLFGVALWNALTRRDP